MYNHPSMKTNIERFSYILGFFILGLSTVLSTALIADTINADQIVDKVADAANTSKEESLQVTVRPLSELLIKDQNSAPASIISLNHPTISAEITGRITTIKTETGANVKKGQVLASIDCRSYQLAERQAQAAVKVAKTQFNLVKKQFARNRTLLRQGTIAREMFDQAEANQQTTLADIELRNISNEIAQLEVSRCLIRAPFAGQITQRIVQEGQLVAPGTLLFKLLQTGKIEITAELSPDEIQHIKDSPLLEFVTGTLRSKAVLRSIINTIDETTRTQEVRLAIANKTRIGAGLSGRLEWASKQSKIPAEYIMRRNNSLGVMIALSTKNTKGKRGSENKNQGKAKFHPLPNAREGQPSYIDLPSKSLIVDQNRYRLKNKQTINWEK